MAPATTHAHWQRSFSELCSTARNCHPDGAKRYRQPGILWCEQLQRFAPLTGVTLNSGCKQSTMPSLCATSLKNPSGWSCSLRMDPIRTPLTKNSAMHTPNIMPVHERQLKVGALASVFRKYPWLLEQLTSRLRQFWLKQQLQTACRAWSLMIHP